MDDGTMRGMYEAQCFLNRDAVHIPKLIEASSHCVHILTTSLDYVCTYLQDPLRVALEKNQKNPDYNIVMLTMDPESEATNGRAEQLIRPLREFRDELRAALDEMVRRFGNESQVSILKYRTLPTQITYIIDHVVVTAVVSIGLQSRDGVHFVMQENQALLGSFTTHFRRLMEVSVPVNPR
jgi:hypothetical protein